MTVLPRFFRSPIVVSRGSVFLMALSSALAIAGLFLALLFAQRQADASDARAECRSRINQYVEGLSIERDNATAFGLLDQVGAFDLPMTFGEAVDQATESALLLEAIRPYREDAVAICASNPDFDPTTVISTKAVTP